ncbi:MAG: hypothetical protein IJQ71_05500 [Clostridia bacterium]|nr:hypothetical protein [Clostridia bacterium]
MWKQDNGFHLDLFQKLLRPYQLPSELQTEHKADPETDFPDVPDHIFQHWEIMSVQESVQQWLLKRHDPEKTVQYKAEEALLNRG